MAEAVPAIRDHNPGVARADERVELLAVAVLGDLKERRGRRGRGPQRAALTAGPPAGLIDMHRRLIEHPVRQLRMRAGERVGSALADRVDRTGRQRDAEQIAGQLGDRSTRDAMSGGQCQHRRLQAHPERGRADALRQPSAGPCATVPTPQLVRAMLGHDHADRWQLGDLVATELPARPTLPTIEPTPAATTRIRVVIDDLINLILGPQLTTRTPMPGLPARRAALTLATHQFLGLGARLRPPLFCSVVGARLPARRGARVFGGSDDGGLELERES